MDSSMIENNRPNICLKLTFSIFNLGLPSKEMKLIIESFGFNKESIEDFYFSPCITTATITPSTFDGVNQKIIKSLSENPTKEFTMMYDSIIVSIVPQIIIPDVNV